MLRRKLSGRSHVELRVDALFSPKTEVFYDLIISCDPQKSLEFVPTAGEIERLSKTNPNGYSTGMEDGMIIGGIMMCAVLDKYEMTKDPSLKNSPTLSRAEWQGAPSLPRRAGSSPGP